MNRKNNSTQSEPEVWIVTLLTLPVAIFLVNFLPIILATFIYIILWGSIMGIIGGIQEKKRKQNEFSTGITFLSPENAEEKLKQERSSYEYALSQRNESPAERYRIKFESMDSFFNLGRELARDEIAEGIYMQNSEAPQADWSIAGGIASGLAGGAAGIATAMDIMQQNAKATQLQHERGRKMEEDGRNSLAQIDRNEHIIKSQNYDRFVFTEFMPELLEHINISCNDIINYGTGYIELKACVFSDMPMTFPNSSTGAKIDGSICINLYEMSSKNIRARGYYNAPGRFGNNRKATGFRQELKEETIILKMEHGETFNKHNGYTISISNPKLWLLKL